MTKPTNRGVRFLFTNRALPILCITEGTMPETSYSDYEIQIDLKRRSLKNISFTNCVFRRETFSELTLTNCTFDECSFIGCRFSDVEFHYSLIINSLFNKPRFEQTYLDPNHLKFNFSEWKKDAANINTTLFQRLESDLRDVHQEDFAERAHIQFRRYRRWQGIYRFKQNIPALNKIAIYWHFAVDFLYDLFLLYGYGLYRALLLTVLIFYLGTLGVDHYWTELKLESNVGGLKLDGANMLQKAYFLVVTATTLGYGDITPRSEIGMIFVIVLLAVSIIWTATITALIVKRLVK